MKEAFCPFIPAADFKRIVTEKTLFWSFGTAAGKKAKAAVRRDLRPVSYFDMLRSMPLGRLWGGFDEGEGLV